MEAGPLGEPIPDEGRLVGSVVVHNQVYVQIGGHLCLDGIEALAELHGPVATVALANHLARPGVQRGEQRRGAVANVIMGAPLGLSRSHLAQSHGQQGPGAIQGLDLGLLINAHHQCPLRGVEVKTHYVPYFFSLALFR